ncbi:MAG: O-succinylbenzoic acid--CoA ligase [Bacteroidetes bacterium]|nr:O-succinylbenzoic acid--CoA ligase [Bacteroidota bacterium]
MFSIDFRSSQENIKAVIRNRDRSTWEVPVFDFIMSWFDPGVDSFPVKTSGSTGTPKMIAHSREAITASATRTCDFFGVKEGDTALLSLPATHIGGKMMIARSLVRKLQLICTEPKSDPLAELEYKGQIDFASFTPMQMSMILANAASAARLSQIKQVILGGGEVPYTLREHVQDIAPEVYETYGMTETISHIALKKLNGPDRSEYFTALDGVTISFDTRGCLVINAPHLHEGDIVTNDIINIIDEKQFQWLGRYDNVINTGGIKVYAEEIERKLQPYISGNFFITGTPDDILGQQVTLIIEGKENTLLINEVNAALDKYEKVRRVLPVGKFVYTETGKVNKKETIKQAII